MYKSFFETCCETELTFRTAFDVQDDCRVTCDQDGCVLATIDPCDHFSFIPSFSSFIYVHLVSVGPAVLLPDDLYAALPLANEAAKNGSFYKPYAAYSSPSLKRSGIRRRAQGCCEQHLCQSVNSCDIKPQVAFKPNLDVYPGTLWQRAIQVMLE